MDTLIKFFMKNKFISWYRYILHWKESNWLLCLQDMGLKFLGLEKKKTSIDALLFCLKSMQLYPSYRVIQPQ